MALTNFAGLTAEQKTIWSMMMWKESRNKMFVNRFMGETNNSMIQHIKELTKTEKGTRAVLTLISDLEGDGIAGDRTLEGNEEAIQSFDEVIQVDQLRHANRNKGRISDQKSIVRFREASRNVLAYWLAERLDQLAFLTLAGITYDKHTDGRDRVASDLANLDYAADVSAPTAARRLRWNSGTGVIEPGAATTDVVAADTPSYDMLVTLKAYANTHGIRPVMMNGNEEVYNVFLTPAAMGKLKLDPDYKANLQYAQRRGENNPLFTGMSVMVDGLIIHEFRHVPNVRLAIAPNKFGASGDLEGCHMLFCGAQALGFADIGVPYWVEKEFDFENQPAISIGKMCGLKKPKFRSIFDRTEEDFGVAVVYVAE